MKGIKMSQIASLSVKMSEQEGPKRDEVVVAQLMKKVVENDTQVLK